MNSNTSTTTCSSGSSDDRGSSSPRKQKQLRRQPLAAREPAEYWRRVALLYAGSGAIILGNVLEWYDWTVYGYMEDVISDLFFGGKSTQAWLVFAVPFIARPFGSVVLGWVGDVLGRTVALNAAIWGMALSTVLQGCLVPHMPGATAVLIALRIISGISAGGEAAGVNTYMTEIGGKDREETIVAAVGVNNVSGSLAFFLSNAVALAVHRLPKEAQLSWAWRVPFLLAAPVGLLSVILRRRMAETEDFKEAQRASSESVESSDEEQEERTPTVGSRNPSATVVGPPETEQSGEAAMEGGIAAKPHAQAQQRSTRWEDVRAILLVLVVIAAINSCNYLPLYLVKWLRNTCNFSATSALGLAALSKIVQLVMTLPVSFVGDRFGATTSMLAGGGASMILLLPALLLVLGVVGAADLGPGEAPPAGVVAMAFMVLGMVLPAAMSFSVLPCMLYVTSLFPAQVRGRGAGIGYGLASLAGGFTPMVCSVLAQYQDWFPGLLVTVLTVPSLATIIWSRYAAGTGQLQIYQRPWLY